jgi:hypothetical protein
LAALGSSGDAVEGESMKAQGSHRCAVTRPTRATHRFIKRIGSQPLVDAEVARVRYRALVRR